MFPVRDRNELKLGYHFGDKTFYNEHHSGVDLIVPVGTPIFAPFDGVVVKNPFKDGGNVIDFHFTKDGKDYVMRCLHLSEYRALGEVAEGVLIGISGNTGELTTGAHIHLDLSVGSVKATWPGNFIDPLSFNWEDDMGLADSIRKNIIDVVKVAGTDTCAIVVDLDSMDTWNKVSGNAPLVPTELKPWPNLSEQENRKPSKINQVLFEVNAGSEELKNKMIDLQAASAEVSTERDLAQNIVAELKKENMDQAATIASLKQDKIALQKQLDGMQGSSQIMQEKLGALQAETVASPGSEVGIWQQIINFISKLMGK